MTVVKQKSLVYLGKVEDDLGGDLAECSGNKNHGI